MMKLRRIFIAINLPESFKKQLLAYREKWRELPAKWTAPENLHLTLAFLGNTSDQELAEVCSAMKQIGKRHSPFKLEIAHLQYGPDKERPRMIWAIVEKTPKLLALQKDIETTVGQSEDMPFSPHLTLARLKAFELQRMELEELPEVNEAISLTFEVNSVEIMESTLKRSGAQYTIVQGIPCSLKPYEKA